MRKLFIATANPLKWKEIADCLGAIPFTLVHPEKVVPKTFTVEEQGTSFMDNALTKARAYGKKAKLLTLAEDSGLEVEALDNKPGIHSRRFSEGTDKERCAKLLAMMVKMPREKRSARFRSAVALYDPLTDKQVSCEASCTGVITTELKGKNGFGYDPIFYLPSAGKTMAELSMKQKNSVSHRGRALAKAKVLLLHNPAGAGRL